MKSYQHRPVSVALQWHPSPAEAFALLLLPQLQPPMKGRVKGALSA